MGKEACDKTKIESLAKAYATNSGLRAVVPYCCSWSYCNFNETSLTMTDPSAPLLRQLEESSNTKVASEANSTTVKTTTSKESNGTETTSTKSEASGIQNHVVLTQMVWILLTINKNYFC